MERPEQKFLTIRLTDDDRGDGNGNGSDGYTPRPRVQLALNFVEPMAKNSEFTEFLRVTLSVRRPESESTETAQHGRPDNKPQDGQECAAMSVLNDSEREAVSLEAVEVGNGRETKQETGKRINGIIHEVAKTGRCAVLKEFLTKENVNTKNNIGETVLHLAAEFEHAGDVQILLDAGATTFMVCVVITDVYKTPGF